MILPITGGNSVVTGFSGAGQACQGPGTNGPVLFASTQVMFVVGKSSMNYPESVHSEFSKIFPNLKRDWLSKAKILNFFWLPPPYHGQIWGPAESSLATRVFLAAQRKPVVFLTIWNMETMLSSPPKCIAPMNQGWLVINIHIPVQQNGYSGSGPRMLNSQTPYLSWLGKDPKSCHVL